MKAEDFVIRADGAKDENGNIEKSIYQIDKDGKIIDRAVDYRLLSNLSDRKQACTQQRFGVVGAEE